MTQAARQLAARMAAVNFTLAHGEAIGDDAGQITQVLAQALLRFESAAAPAWHGYAAALRAHLALDAARYLLANVLTQFNRSLFDHDRFEWRVRFCRLLLAYMGEQDIPDVQNAFSALTDYYCLVWDAQYSGIHYRGELLTKPHYDEYDGPDAGVHIVFIPN